MIADNVNRFDFHTTIFLHMEHEVHSVANLLIRFLFDCHIGIIETLLNVVFLDDVGTGLLQVIVHNIALRQFDFFTDFILFVFLGACEGKSGQAGAFHQMHIKENHILQAAGNGDVDILEHACFPQFLDGLGDLLARDFYQVAHPKHQHTLVEIGGAGRSDTADFIQFGRRIIQ